MVFLLTLHRDGAWGFVNAAAEAAMVGALADWFAVTALFRHPLGLPVPHTAIIPKRKDALGRSLQEFVTENFLTEESPATGWPPPTWPERVGAWLEDDAQPRVVAEVATATGPALARCSTTRCAPWSWGPCCRGWSRNRWRRSPAGCSAEVVDGGPTTGWSTSACRGHAWLVGQPAHRRAGDGARAPWWSPQWLDDKVIDRVHHEAVAWVADVRDNPRHPARRALDDLLSQLGRDLQDDPRRWSGSRRSRRGCSPTRRSATRSAAVESVRTALLAALADEDGPLRRRAVEALCSLGPAAAATTSCAAGSTAHISEAVGWVVEPTAPRSPR